MFLHVFTFHSSPHFLSFHFLLWQTSIKLIKMSSHISYPIVLQTAHTNIPMSQAIYIILSLRGLISTSVKIMDKWLVHMPISSKLHCNTKGKSNHLINYTLSGTMQTHHSFSNSQMTFYSQEHLYLLPQLFVYVPTFLFIRMKL